MRFQRKTRKEKVDFEVIKTITNSGMQLFYRFLLGILSLNI